jgi:tRNA threonylcarbamoyl adenosine modification protein YeaZ
LILAFDTSTAACTAALFAPDGTLLASADEVIGRGHAERLVPMIAEMLGPRRPERVLVGCGPGSFTGLRVGIAAAHGLAIGWDAELAGFSSLALLAAGRAGAEPVIAAVPGGHGELFLQEFGDPARAALGPLHNLPPDAAGAAVTAHQAIGPAARALVAARGWGEAIEALPTASHLLRLPAELRSLSPRPIYARAPDARPKAA